MSLQALGANSFSNGISRPSHDGDIDVTRLTPGYRGSMPLFVPRVDAGSEHDSYLMEVVYNSFEHKSELMILCADDMNRLCNLKLRHHVPRWCHGFYTPEVFRDIAGG